MVRMVLPKPPEHPQRKYAYANLGYVVAAAMLETRAGESFESLMKKHLFEPLEMQSADFRTLKQAEQMKPPFVWGHRQGQPVDPRLRGAENPTAYAGCGTVHLNIEDYAKYAQWHLAGEPQPVLQTQEAFDHLHQPLVDHAGAGMKYACGWICATTALGPGLNHGGSNTNSFALIWVVPDADFAAVVCTNSGEPQAFPACDEVMGYLMQQHEVDPGEVTPDRLVGRYQLNPNFIFDVQDQDGHLMVGITNQPTQEVFADSPTKWSYRSVEATLEFHLHAEGPAYALTLHQNGLAQQAARIVD